MKYSGVTDLRVFEEVSEEVDLYKIIREKAIDKLRQVHRGQVEKVALGIFNMIGYINFVLAQKYFALQRKSLSIRDILSMIDFLKVTSEKVF